MPKKSYNTADLRLDNIKGLTSAMKKAISSIASQIGALSATDVQQLRDLAALEVRIAVTEKMVAKAAEQDDLNLWHRISTLVDKQIGQKRMILKDLKITRSSLPNPSTGAREAKAQGKSGTDWEGVL